MGRKLEWELSGKSDVPQKMAQAKASMEGLEDRKSTRLNSSHT